MPTTYSSRGDELTVTPLSVVPPTVLPTVLLCWRYRRERDVTVHKAWGHVTGETVTFVKAQNAVADNYRITTS